jgi:hypothetical protein
MRLTGPVPAPTGTPGVPTGITNRSPGRVGGR